MKELSPEERALVVVLPDPIAARIDRWREQYDPNYEILPPHITVVYPPFVPEQDWPSVRDEVAACLRPFPAFTVRLAEFGVFDDGPFYLWLRPEDGGDLARIHSALARSFAQYSTPFPSPYAPHLTIGVFDSWRDLSVAQHAITQAWSPCQFEVDQLVYLSPNSRGLWCTCSRLPLGTRPSEDRGGG